MGTLKDNSCDSGKGANAAADSWSKEAIVRWVVMAALVMFWGFVLIGAYCLNWDSEASFNALVAFVDPGLNPERVGLLCTFSVLFTILWLGVVIAGDRHNYGGMALAMLPASPILIFVVAIVYTICVRIYTFAAAIPTFLANHVHWVCGTAAFYVVIIPALVATVAIAISYIRKGALRNMLERIKDFFAKPEPAKTAKDKGFASMEIAASMPPHPLYDPDIQ